MAVSFCRRPGAPHLLALASALVLAGCYGLSEPSFHPGDHRDILASITRRGVVASEPLAGETACADHELVGNALYLTARMPDEDEPRDVYVHIYREKRWGESEAEVDACQAQYAASDPGSEITRLDIPTYRVFGADWSDELTEALTDAFEEAAEAGRAGR